MTFANHLLRLFMHVATITAFAVSASAAATVRDASGREVVIRDASRVVSIGGAVTEILYALGQGNRIVAVDTTSLYPPEALKTKPNVGYFRQLSPEGVIGLTPSLIIAADGSGPKEAVSVLEAASVPFVRIPDNFDDNGIIEKIRIIAKATGAERQGDCLEKLVSEDLESLSAIRKQIKTPARAMFIVSFINGKPMVGGRGTAADGIIRMAGAVNIFGEFEGYKIVNDEAVVAAAPDWVLGMQRPGFDLDAAGVFSHAAFRQTPAARQGHFFSMDGLYMLGFGPRTARAARDLSRALYPDLKAGSLPSDDSGRDAQICAK
jgi:iron complex transport system substrate-binding protein